jgi:hypothetical protein
MYGNRICWSLVIRNPSARIIPVSLVNASIEPGLDPIAKALLLSHSSLSHLLLFPVFAQCLLPGKAALLDRLICSPPTLMGLTNSYAFPRSAAITQ